MKLNDNIELLHGDCLELMKELYDNDIIVDAIITDPPYNISRDNNFKTMKRNGINFGEWDKGFNITSWIYDASLLLKKGGNIVIFCDWKSITPIVEELESQNFDVKDLIRWKKQIPCLEIETEDLLLIMK